MAPRKAITSAWRLLHDRLQTRHNLLRRGIIPAAEDLCPVCSGKKETAQHLFLHCSAATRLWQHIYDWIDSTYGSTSFFQFLKTVPSHTLIDHCSQLSFLIPGDDKGLIGSTLWIGVTWQLWSMRNDIIFNGNPLNLENALWKIKIDLWNWMKAKELINLNLEFSVWSGDKLSCN
ncbi:hypothetical protein ACS0TY_005378 [Phlomoides rotata]